MMDTTTLQAAVDAATDELHVRDKAMGEAQKRIDEATADSDLDALRTEFDTAAAAFDEQADEVERVKRNLADHDRREKIRAENPAPVREAARPNGSTVEPAVYSEHDRTASFFGDAYRHQFNADSAARERLERHGKQNVDQMRAKGVQLRDVGTGAFAGLTVPQYLIDLFAPFARAGAPLLSYTRKLPLPPSGMTVNISRITTGSAVAAQATENSGVQETDIDDTLLTINVRTYAGQQDVSRQALERSELVDFVVFQDMIADYFTKLDSAIINADGTSGTHLGIRSTSSIVSVTYTDGSPTVPELYPKQADAIQQVETGVFKPPTLIVDHPRRWAWKLAALDSSSRPLVLPNTGGPYNAFGVNDSVDYGKVVGTQHGLPIITDSNIPTTLGAGTNEDVELILRVEELLFWQDGDGNPRQFRFEQANAPQSVRLAVWGYSAFTAGRYPSASAVIGGTGLAAPSF